MERRQRSSGLAEGMRHLGLGMSWMLTMLAFAALGRWLDGRFGSTPALTLAGALIGSVVGFAHLYRQAVVVPREEARRRRESGTEGGEEPR
jgi:ATP synthase protein I